MSILGPPPPDTVFSFRRRQFREEHASQRGLRRAVGDGSDLKPSTSQEIVRSIDLGPGWSLAGNWVDSPYAKLPTAPRTRDGGWQDLRALRRLRLVALCCLPPWRFHRPRTSTSTTASNDTPVSGREEKKRETLADLAADGTLRLVSTHLRRQRVRDKGPANSPLLPTTEASACE